MGDAELIEAFKETYRGIIKVAEGEDKEFRVKLSNFLSRKYVMEAFVRPNFGDMDELYDFMCVMNDYLENV